MDHLSPAQTARRFGVSIKALRLYEQRGLLTPVRTANGATGSAWRVYGPDQIARLHQILALKRLGLSLARIGQLLGGAGALAPVLALQEEALERDAARLTRALALVRGARAKLASGQALSIDDLANLTKETVMTKLDNKEMGQVLKPFVDRHFSAEDKDTLKDRPVDQAQAAKDWEDLIAEARQLLEIGDPTSPAAHYLARRWGAMVQQFTGGDAAMGAKAKAVWNDALDDPAAAGKLALNKEIFAFVYRAAEDAKRLTK